MDALERDFCAHAHLASVLLAATLVAAGLSGCGDGALSAQQACAEQADGWCANSVQAHGYDFNCRKAYELQCSPAIGIVPHSEQDACLDAIYAAETPMTCVPAACVATWHRDGEVLLYRTCR